VSAHTEGPWHVTRRRDYPFVVHIANGGYLGFHGPDAQLIAAAPELLAALQQLLRWNTSVGEGSSAVAPLPALNAARDAIIKAGGNVS
jgi:hypothetical protein